jgi:hypothetical protein
MTSTSDFAADSSASEVQRAAHDRGRRGCPAAGLNRCVPVMAMAILAVAAPSKAQPLFSSLGPSDSFSTVEFSVTSMLPDLIIGTQIVPTAGGIVSAADVPLRSQSGTPMSVRLEIRTDAAGIPSETVISIGSRSDINSLSLYTFAMSPVTLNAGQAYWLVAGKHQQFAICRVV